MFCKCSKMENLGPVAKNVCENTEDIETEGGLETANENVRESVES